MMLIGTSLMPCLCSVAMNQVRADDILVIISRTTHKSYDMFLLDLKDYYKKSKDVSSIDQLTFLETGAILWQQGKIHQPSAISGKYGYLHVELSRGELWLPVVPSPKTDDQRVVDAYQKYMVLVNLIK